MSDKPTFTRREFVHTGMALASTIATVPAFLNNSAYALTDPDSAVKSKPGVPDDRIFVVVQLSGGNDGLNTVIPFGDREYHNNRPRIKVAQEDIITLDKQKGIGLHPSMKPIAELIDAGVAGIVQGVGYPNPNRSHFASMDIWHAGDTLGGRDFGWIGKTLDEVTGGQVTGDNATCCVSIGREAPLAAQGKHIKPVTVERANLFRWAAANQDAALDKAYHKFNRSGAPEGRDPNDPTDQAAFVMRTTLDAQIASDRIRAAAAKGTQTQFPRSGLGQQLQLVASMIRAGLPTRVYYVAMGGFDTHAGQANRHANLLTQFSEAMKAFYTEMKAINSSGRVLTMAFSEFGRRVKENASAGTDHGCAGPSFIMGDMVEQGLIGNYPSLTRLDKGDLIHTLDFRSMYASVIDQWLKADSQKILGRRFPHAPILQQKTA